MRMAAIGVVAGGLAWLSWGHGAQGAPPSQQDFQWHGHLAAGQTVTVKGINGDVRAVPASGADVEVTAVKHARRSDPDEVRIEVVPGDAGVTICAVYPASRGRDPNECLPGRHGHSESHHNDTEVDFTVHVPRGVNFDGRTVSGDVTTEALGGNVAGHSVNGDVDVTASGYAEATSVNGEVRAALGRADWTGSLEFSSVNGGVTVILPAHVDAEVTASTVNGGIDSDFPLTVQGRFSARHVSATIGSGGRGLQLHTVNGTIRLRRASAP